MPQYKQTIDDDSVCLFIHIPKTGGLTFRNIIENYFDNVAIFPFPSWRSWRQSNFPREKLEQYQLVSGHFAYSMHRFFPQKEPIFVTMLRDPIERVLSQYAYVSRESHLPFYQIIQTEKLDLLGYIQHPEIEGSIQNIQSRYIGSQPDESTLQQVFDVQALPYGGIELAVERLKDISWVGLMERYQESLFLLAYTFGWYPVVQYERLNTAPKRLKQDDLDTSTLALLQTKNEDDKRLYEQAKQVFETRYEAMVDDLLEKYGAASHAKMSLPLPAEVMEDLLVQHYEERYTDLNTAHKQINFQFGERISGIGWYPAHRTPQQAVQYRWSGPDTLSVLDFAIQSESPLVLRFRILRPQQPEILDSLKVLANQQDIALQCTPQDVGYIFEGLLPQSVFDAKKGLLRLKFVISHTAPPRFGEKRNQGLLLQWLEIAPVPLENNFSSSKEESD